MLRCIQLAKNGLGTTYPNPLVGCVIVHDDQIIGEGWHYRAGEPHAEVNAIKSVGDKSLLASAILYVSLEPCSHFGKTPPCADFIISKGIKNIVIGSSDPNPKIAGKGIVKLTEAGCRVTVGVLEAACDALNKRFFTFQNQNRPFVVLKWAQTTDGLIAPASKKTQAPVWITNTFSRQLTHKMRTEEQAILIGTNTAMEDNPTLTARSWHGMQPWRIVLDRTLRISENAAVYNQDTKTIFITGLDKPNTDCHYFEKIDFQAPIASQVCTILKEYDIQSVIVEGGTQTIQNFIDVNLWDEALIFEGPGTLTTGVAAPKIKGETISVTTIAGDTLRHLKNNSQ